MSLYECKKCKNKREIQKQTLVFLQTKKMWVVKEALCGKNGCNEFMVSKPNEGIPSLIRTEPTLNKK